MRTVEVFGRVLARRVVAASNMPACEAQPQMEPLLPRLEAFLATVGGAWFDAMNVFEMRAQECHWSSFVVSQQPRDVTREFMSVVMWMPDAGE